MSNDEQGPKDPDIAEKAETERRMPCPDPPANELCSRFKEQWFLSAHISFPGETILAHADSSRPAELTSPSDLCEPNTELAMQYEPHSTGCDA